MTVVFTKLKGTRLCKCETNASDENLAFRFSFIPVNFSKTLERITAALLSTALTCWTLSALSATSLQGRSFDFIPKLPSLAST